MFLSSSFETCVVSGLFSRERKGRGREGLELIIHKGVSFTQQISSLVSICDAKAWSHKKEEKEKLWVCWMFWPLDCLYMLNRGWTLYKRWVTKSWLSTRSQFHSTNCPTKKKKRKCNECAKFFGNWTVFMRWAESGLCTRHGGLRADALRSQTHSHSTNLFLSLSLWCKDLVPQKRRKGKAVSVLNVSATGLSLCAEQRVDFVWEMGD